MNNSIVPQRERIVGLDSLRFLAFLSIFLYHSIPSFNYGYLGVDFFFVLSSFLLTYLALDEIKRTDSFSKGYFFVRRALRIFPLYFLMLSFSFFILPLFAQLLNEQVTLPDSKLMYWFFLSNYDTQDCLIALKFLWSIAVEEQFYLLFILLSFLFRKHIALFIVGLLICYFAFMIYSNIHNQSFYPNTLAHFANFSMGMTAAYFYFTKKIQQKQLVFLFTISVILLFITFSNPTLFNFILSISFASAILLVIGQQHHFARYKMFKYVEHLGKYTYGLYIYSGFVFTFGYKFLPITNKPVLITIELALTILIASLSYELFERKFLKLKNHFRHE